MSEVMPVLLKEQNVQLVALGEPDPFARHFFKDLENQFPSQVGTHLMANFTLPRKIFSGSDIFLIPSAYEPGGITCIEALRYGAIPIVRATGGLADIVEDYDPETNNGNGFSFNTYDKWAFYAALVRALETYKNKRVWRGIVRRAMQQDFSWEHSALKYIDLYQRAIRFRLEALQDNPHQAYRHITFSLNLF